jgi:hypothetical protein
MAEKKDLTQSPYNDDYDESKNYHRILYIPGRAVQARELTQQQTINQNQIEKIGTHLFQDGSLILPGDINYEANVPFVRFDAGTESLTQEELENRWLNKTVIGQTNFVEAVVIYVEAADANNNITLYLKYTKTSSDGLIQIFEAEELISTDDALYSATLIPIPAIPTDPQPTGIGTSATIKEGTYYTHGFFVNVYEQRIILSQDQNPTISVGLEYEELVLDEEDDPSLLDNARESRSYTAPGAHRLQLNLILTKKDVVDGAAPNNENYLELLRLVDGEIVKYIDKTFYNVLSDEFARRTFDESGNYTVRPFLGTVEAHPTDNTKLNFVVDPGKAFVKGYEIETITKTTLELNKARDFQSKENINLQTNIGNYIEITNLSGLPKIDEYDVIEMYDELGGTGQLVGTTRARSVNFISGNGGESDAIYAMYIFDTKFTGTNTIRNVKSFKFDDQTVANEDFSADINPEYVILEGLASYAGGVVTGDGRTRWTSIDNQRIYDGDLIRLSNGQNSAIYKVTDAIDDNTLSVTYLSGDLTDPLENATVELLIGLIQETVLKTPIFHLPSYGVKDVSDVTFSSKRRFIATASGTQVQLSTNNSDEVFVSTQSSVDYVLYNYTTGQLIPNDGLSISITNNGATVTLSHSTGGVINDSDKIEAVCTIIHLQPTIRSKNRDNALININSGENKRTISLGVADAIIINSVTRADDINFTNNVEDITDKYDLDDGQRDTYYGIAKALLKSTESEPSGYVRIDFDYFNHGSGNFFDISSYVDGSIPREDIPTYYGLESGYPYDLTSCLDFRPTQVSDGVFNITQATELPTTSIILDYEYYLGRIDKVFIDENGSFDVVEGVSADIPRTPEAPKNSMVIYELAYEPYTINELEVSKNFIKNKGYTMNDIAKLERRIETLEYYTELTLLEKEAADLEILDDDGLNRFKNGFIVDSFSGHSIGDVTDPDYNCSIDPQHGEMRPVTRADNISLSHNQDASLNDNIIRKETTDDYGNTLKSDAITLDYTEKLYIEQAIATDTINVLPFFTGPYLGTMKLKPSSDQWRDTQYTPDPQVIIEDGGYEAAVQLAESLGTIYGEWETNWTGKERQVDILNKETVKKLPETQESWNKAKRITKRKKQKGLQISGRGLELVKRTKAVTVTKTGTATRTNYKLTVNPKIIEKPIGDKVVSVEYVNYMRARNILVEVKKMKPNSVVYATFDDIDVSAYCYNETTPGSGVINDDNTVSGFETTAATQLQADEAGRLRFLFKLPDPNTGSVRFQTGKRLFLLTNAPIDQTGEPSTAKAFFEAEGLLETKQRQVLATRTPVISKEFTNETNQVSEQSTKFKTDLKWEDPIAQTFLVEQEGGVFLTKVDLFFSTKDANIPIEFEIRETVNGYPGQLVIPFSNVILPPDKVNTNYVEFTGSEEEGNLAATKLYINDVEQSGLSPEEFNENFLATSFEFAAPIYLQQGVEYSFVVKANTKGYQMWKSTYRKTQVGKDIQVTKNPYAGVMFKSQNASTWTADQESDVMFRIYRASFDTNPGYAHFENISLPLDSLDNNPIEVATGTTLARVKHFNHGHFVRDDYHLGNPVDQPPLQKNCKVILDGVDLDSVGVDADLYVNGKEFTIRDVRLDSYVIDLAENKDINPDPVITGSGFSGGSEVLATQNFSYETLHIMANTLQLPGTSLVWNIKTTSSKGVDDIQNVNTPGELDSSFANITINEDVKFNLPRVVMSDNNEEHYKTGATAEKSLQLRASLFTERENLSPVIDTERLSVISVANRFDTPTYEGLTSTVVEELDVLELISSGDTLTGTLDIIQDSGNIGRIEADDDNDANLLNSIQIGEHIELQGTVADDGDYLVTGINYDLGSTPAISISVERTDGNDIAGETGITTGLVFQRIKNFIDEIAPYNCTAKSRYVVRQMVLAQPANALHLRLAAAIEDRSEIEVYYRILTDNSQVFWDLPYVKAEFDGAPEKSSDANDFREYEITVNDLPDFTMATAKVVLKGTDPTRPPLVQEFILTALGT